MPERTPSWIIRPKPRGGKLDSVALRECELDRELADVLPHRDTLTVMTLPGINVVVVEPQINVVAQVATAVAVAVGGLKASAGAWATNGFHL
jgi:hypothetical protein